MGNPIKAQIAKLRLRLSGLRSDAKSRGGWTREQIVVLNSLVGNAKILLAPVPALVQLEGRLVEAESTDERLMRFVRALNADSAVLDALEAALDLWPKKDFDWLNDAVEALARQIILLEKLR